MTTFKPARVLLHSRATQQYVAGSGLWVSQPKYALSFPDGGAAAEFAKNNHLSQMEVIISRDAETWEVRVPLPDYAVPRPPFTDPPRPPRQR
jgi:hypothetical protein